MARKISSSFQKQVPKSARQHSRHSFSRTASTLPVLLQIASSGYSLLFYSFARASILNDRRKISVIPQVSFRMRGSHRRTPHPFLKMQIFSRGRREEYRVQTSRKTFRKLLSMRRAYSISSSYKLLQREYFQFFSHIFDASRSNVFLFRRVRSPNKKRSF